MLHLLLGILLSLTSVHGQSFFKGDVDGDEEFTRSDVERAAEVILGSVPSDENTAFAADFNDDGNVDALDVVGMLNLLEERPQTVVVELPEGMDASGMVLLSGPYEVKLGSAKPAGKRKYELKLGRPEVPRIIMALDKSGDVAFLGIQKIGAVIGKGGETIRGLEADYEVEITIDDDGLVAVVQQPEVVVVESGYIYDSAILDKL